MLPALHTQEQSLRDPFTDRSVDEEEKRSDVQCLDTRGRFSGSSDLRSVPEVYCLVLRNPEAPGRLPVHPHHFQVGVIPTCLLVSPRTLFYAPLALLLLFSLLVLGGLWIFRRLVQILPSPRSSYPPDLPPELCT